MVYIQFLVKSIVYFVEVKRMKGKWERTIEFPNSELSNQKGFLIS